MSVCDHCGEPNAEAARFCSSCGAELPERVREGLEVRKTVTVLFCDVVGSTALGEAADPETTRRVMARYAQEMAEVVEAHGGTVERFRGDEVMAVFGVPVVHEDDALRAVRAGMAMQARLAGLNSELQETWGVELACRIGINTGEVVAGDPGTGSTFVTGDAVNLGKRLEQAASPGEILIGTATYPLVRDAVRVGPRERFSAKGKRGPVERFRLDDVDADAAGIARRLDAPLVGRLEELERVQTVIEAALDEGRCTVVSITGAAGIGKSRLAREVTIRLGARARIGAGRCLPYGSGITYWPLVELVHDLGGLDDLAERLEATPEGSSAIDSVRTAVSSSDTVASNDEVFWGVRRILEALAADRPLVLCLDDMHWAEPTMLDLVDYLGAFARGPIALLCTARPELLDRRPGWAMHPLFELGHLTPAETGELVEHLGVQDEDVRERIADTAEGNPLFAEQLAAMVLDAGAGPDDVLALPASIHALIAARLDTLEAPERRVLERAAVVGKEFWWSAVADLSAEPDRPHIGGRLLALTRKGLIHPVTTESRGEHTFRFRHALIRDTAYAAMPKAVRTDLHEAFADWLEGQTPRGFGEHPEIVGYHAEQAFRLRSELGVRDGRTRELGERAAALLRTAGHQAFARDDMPAAASLIERALELTSPGDRVELEFELSGALWSVGDRERADELLESVASLGDERLRWHALLERAAFRELAHEAEPNSLLDTARQAQQYFEEVGDDVGLARAWRRIAFVQRREGAFGAAAEASERAFAHAASAGDAREKGRIVDGLCSALLYGPTAAPPAIERCEHLLDGPDAQPSLAAAVYSSLAGLLAMQERFDEARDVYARAKRLWEELGLRYAVAGLTQIGAEVELLAGDPVAAERELRIGEEIFAKVGGSPVQSALLGKALLAQGRLDEAWTQALEARDHAGEEVLAEVVGGTVAGVAAMRGARADDAIGLAEDAVLRARGMEAPNLQADALEALATCLAAVGRQAEATAARDEALRLYDAKGNLASARRVADGVI